MPWTPFVALHSCFVELAVRLEFVGLLDHDSFTLPLTQADIGSACGLSTVHTNRTLQSLWKQGLLEWRGEQVSLPNRAELEELAEFNPDYLQRKAQAA